MAAHLWLLLILVLTSNSRLLLLLQLHPSPPPSSLQICSWSQHHQSSPQDYRRLSLRPPPPSQLLHRISRGYRTFQRNWQWTKTSLGCLTADLAMFHFAGLCDGDQWRSWGRGALLPAPHPLEGLPGTKLHCTALHCTALHCTALHLTILHYPEMQCTTLQWSALN